LIATDKAIRDAIERRFIALNAAKSGFQYVDIDLESPRIESLTSEVKASGAQCIISYHYKDACPNIGELHTTLKKEIARGADVCKIVANVTQMQDNLTLLQFTSEAAKQTKVVCFGMGDLGKTSRFLSPTFGGFFTFASLEKGNETAPGQMTLEEMRSAYKILGLA